MSIRCTLPARIAAFIIMMAAMFLAPSAGQAQVVDCGRCDHFTIDVSRDFSCRVTICYMVSPDSRPICTIVSPGESLTVPCPPYRVWVNTCDGQYSIVPAASDTRCSPVLKFAENCCGQICVVPSVDPCPRLLIQPSPCLSPGCP